MVSRTNMTTDQNEIIRSLEDERDRLAAQLRDIGQHVDVMGMALTFVAKDKYMAGRQADRKRYHDALECLKRVKRIYGADVEEDN